VEICFQKVTKTTEATETTKAAENVEGVVNVETPEILSGGWVRPDHYVQSEMSEEDIERFNKAVSSIDAGMSFAPISILATQVVSGTNYAYLCEGTMVTQESTSSLYIALLYEGFSGEVSLLQVKELKISDLLAEKDAYDASKEENSEELVGGFCVNEEVGGVLMPGTALTAFTKLFSEIEGASYRALSLVAEQVVSGRNYMVLSIMTPVTAEPVSTLQVLYIYEDLSGNVSLTEAVPFSIGKFLTEE